MPQTIGYRVWNEISLIEKILRLDPFQYDISAAATKDEPQLFPRAIFQIRRLPS